MLYIYSITIIGSKLHFQTQLDSSPAFLCIPASFLCIPVHSCLIPVYSCLIPADSGLIPVDSCGFLWIPAESGNSGRNLWGSEKDWVPAPNICLCNTYSLVYKLHLKHECQYNTYLIQVLRCQE